MNSPASVRARLFNLSKRSGEDFQAVLTRYAVERFLYRVGVGQERDLFVLKGAMLFVVQQGYLHRPTKDVDLLGFGTPSPSDVAEGIRRIAAIHADDGIAFDPDTVEAEVIAEEAEYEGVRAKLVARIEQARIRMQIDVGFGDAVEPAPRIGEFPPMLKDIAAARLCMYPAEAVVAEKLHAMVVLDIRNSRMKDFYDLWYLAKTGTFDFETICSAVRATFVRRRTPVPSGLPFALTDGFLRNENKTTQWLAFLRRLRLDRSTPDLPEVGAVIARFVQPVFSGRAVKATWTAGGPWHE